jgi:hypothetical protein
MAAALAIGMHAHFAHQWVVARCRSIVETLAAAQSADAGRMEAIGEIGGVDFLEGSRASGGLLRVAPFHCHSRSKINRRLR